MLSFLIEESYLKFIEESPHKDNPLLNKYIQRNVPNRQLLAEKLKFLRKARDKSRDNSKTYKANAVDNITRTLTQANHGDPTLKHLISTPLNKMPKEEKNNLFTYKPKFATLPWEKLDVIKDRIDYENNRKGTPLNNKITNYFDKSDVKNLQKSLRINNDKKILDDNIMEMFKYAPRIAATKRESNPQLFYNNHKRLNKFYNIKLNDIIRPNNDIYQSTKI